MSFSSAHGSASSARMLSQLKVSFLPPSSVVTAHAFGPRQVSTRTYLPALHLRSAFESTVHAWLSRSLASSHGSPSEAIWLSHANVIFCVWTSWVAAHAFGPRQLLPATNFPALHFNIDFLSTAHAMSFSPSHASPSWASELSQNDFLSVGSSAQLFGPRQLLTILNFPDAHLRCDFASTEHAKLSSTVHGSFGSAAA